MSPIVRARTRAFRSASVAALLAAAGAVAAAPAAAAPVVEAVTIDCIGDSVVGHVGIQDPENGTARIRPLGRSAGGSFTELAATTVRTEPDMFEIAYSFTVTQHRTE